MTTNTKFPEPYRIEDELLKEYLNELIRSLRDFDNRIFSQDNGLVFETARKNPFRTINDDYSMGSRDSVIFVNASSNSVLVSIPDALNSKGKFYSIKRIDTNGSNVVSVEGSGDEFPYVLSGTSRDSLKFFSNGENLWVF